MDKFFNNHMNKNCKVIRLFLEVERENMNENQINCHSLVDMIFFSSKICDYGF